MDAVPIRAVCRAAESSVDLPEAGLGLLHQDQDRHRIGVRCRVFGIQEIADVTVTHGFGHLASQRSDAVRHLGALGHQELDERILSGGCEPGGDGNHFDLQTSSNRFNS